MKDQIQSKPTPTMFEPSGSASVSAAIQDEAGYNIEDETAQPLLPG
jgi:hypothetical protein